MLLVKPPEINLFVTGRRTGQLLGPTEFDKLDLSVEIDGKRVETHDLVRTAATEVPLLFGLVLDCSGSMLEEDKFKRAKESAIHFVDLKRSEDQACLVSFATRVDVSGAPTRDPYYMREKIEKLVAHGATALYDGIHQGVELVNRGRERRALFVLS
ncbi:MAG: VWA domain-containing protein, partial [Candidatus Riflebacteria bacterium]|nr:VWA domain-containing protein [Candidatus Riflebacteria bacterium]